MFVELPMLGDDRGRPVVMNVWINTDQIVTLFDYDGGLRISTSSTDQAGEIDLPVKAEALLTAMFSRRRDFLSLSDLKWNLNLGDGYDQF
jgi:hypothetical protein